MWLKQFIVTACPTPASGDGHLVTSRFIHENTEVWDLSFERGSAPLGTTASHPFWSEDRQAFVAARDLHRGERLLLADGTTRRLESLTKRPERTTVYNIEVNAQHTYYVGHDGVLVHNTCKRLGPIQNHHKIPWNNKTFNHQNHPLVKLANSNLKTDGRNQMPLGNHAGRHAPEYHQAIRDRMDVAFEDVTGQGSDAARKALDDVMDSIEDDVASGALSPYRNKDVWIPE